MVIPNIIQNQKLLNKYSKFILKFKLAPGNRFEKVKSPLMGKLLKIDDKIELKLMDSPHKVPTTVSRQGFWKLRNLLQYNEFSKYKVSPLAFAQRLSRCSFTNLRNLIYFMGLKGKRRNVKTDTVNRSKACALISPFNLLTVFILTFILFPFNFKRSITYNLTFVKENLCPT